MDWQAFIRSIREPSDGRHVTLGEIAATVDAPLSTISDIARGASKEPRGDLAVRLLRTYGDVPDSKVV